MSSNSDRLSISRRIPAPARRIFAIVADPRGHVRIDGSRMLLAAPDAEPLQGVGDTFEIEMDREPLGDLPLGKYKVVNTVTSFVRDVEVAWTPQAVGKRSVGHVWGYRLEAIGDMETDATCYCDWSAIPQECRKRLSWPVVPARMLERSLENLERIAAQPEIYKAWCAIEVGACRGVNTAFNTALASALSRCVCSGLGSWNRQRIPTPTQPRPRSVPQRHNQPQEPQAN